MGQPDVSQIKPQQTEGFNFNRGTVGTGTTGWVRWLAVTIAIVDSMMAVRAWRRCSIAPEKTATIDYGMRAPGAAQPHPIA